MKRQTIGRKGQLIESLTTKKNRESLSPEEQNRRAIAEEKDTYGLLINGGKAVFDEDREMLEPPDLVKHQLGSRLVVATTPPAIEFAIIPYEDRYFPTMEGDREIGPWSSWGQACYYAADDAFFGAVGDHAWYDPRLHVIKYDSRKRIARCLPEINELLGRTHTQFGEAKIHGYPDVYKASYQQADHVWFCTYWCRYPEPLESDFQTGYSGGHIMSFDATNEQFVDYGVPLQRASWPFHRIDPKIGRLYGSGMFGEFLAWDIDTQETLWAGYPPPGMKWFNRCLMIDNVDGGVYSNNMLSPTKRLIKYDPTKNRFTELDIDMPIDSRLSQPVVIRTHTRKRDKNGIIWGLTSMGELFSFKPSSEQMEIGRQLWPLNDAYSVTMDQSPDGRYLYFGVACHGRGYPYGSPILQHDLTTDTTKILAFLHPYYYEKYGYITGGSYSFKLDDKGERLFMIWNGDFSELGKLEREQSTYNSDDPKNWSVPSPHDAFGHCATILLHIPAEERPE